MLCLSNALLALCHAKEKIATQGAFVLAN